MRLTTALLFITAIGVSAYTVSARSNVSLTGPPARSESRAAPLPVRTSRNLQLKNERRFRLLVGDRIRSGTDAVAGQTERHTQIAGKWKAGGINYEYEIYQNGSTFSWQVTNPPSLNETARGEFTGKDSIKVTWTNRNGSDSATGRITSDANGNATRIDWSNGIVFNRN
jgi:hypothetical protein